MGDMIIYQAISFLKNQLNSYLKFQLGNEYADMVHISNPVSQDGSPASGTTDRVLLTLATIEEEKIGKVQSPQLKTVNGKGVRVSPEINVNLYLLVIANRSNYEESLKFLSHIITFFQGKNVFDKQNSPDLDTEIRKLIIDLHTVSFEQLNNVWGAMGAKYMPSALYKIRMLTVQSNRILESPEFITGINTEL